MDMRAEQPKKAVPEMTVVPWGIFTWPVESGGIMQPAWVHGASISASTATCLSDVHTMKWLRERAGLLWVRSVGLVLSTRIMMRGDVWSSYAAAPDVLYSGRALMAINYKQSSNL